MNISKENIDALNAVLTMEFEKSDYEPKVEKAIKDYGKKVAIKGFRPGHAPVAMIKRMYGKSILVDQVNTLVGESLSSYIRENEINILGEPLPSENQELIDFDKEVDKLTFKFDLGLAPEVNVDVNNSLKVPYYTINVDDAAIDEQIKNVKDRFGNHVAVDAISDKSLIKGQISINGEVKNENAVASISVIKDDAEKAKFIGKKVGDSVVFDARKAYPDDTELSYLLAISKEEAAALNGDATIVLSSVEEYKEAELNKELFDKLYPGQEVADEAAFRAKVAETLSQTNAISEEYRFHVDARKSIMDAAGDLRLPEEFLKRWLTLVNKDNDKFTPDVLTNEFPKFAEDLKWQVVKNAIMKANNLKLEFNDVLDFAKKTTKAQFLQYGITTIPEEQLVQYANNMLKNDEQRSHLTDGAAEEKVVTFAKEHVSIEKKNISSADFGKLFQAEA